jgi:hypothetical protein
MLQIKHSVGVLFEVKPIVYIGVTVCVIVYVGVVWVWGKKRSLGKFGRAGEIALF